MKATTIKAFDVTKNKKWATEPKSIANTHGKKFGTGMQVFTVCGRLPTNFSHVVSVVVNGVLAYDLKEDEKPTCTSVIGGGGRFEVRRTFYDRECVDVTIYFKDVVYFTKRKPTIRIVAAVFTEDEK